MKVLLVSAGPLASGYAHTVIAPPLNRVSTLIRALMISDLGAWPALVSVDGGSSPGGSLREVGIVV